MKSIDYTVLVTGGASSDFINLVNDMVVKAVQPGNSLDKYKCVDIQYTTDVVHNRVYRSALISYSKKF